MFAMIRRIFFALVWALNLRPESEPRIATASLPVTLTANAAAWTWGAWAQIVAAASITEENQITGCVLENFAGTLIGAQGEVQIGTGGAGAEVAFATLPVGAAAYHLPAPFLIPPTTRIAMRYRTSPATADTVQATVQRVSGI